jgi:membrane associated rhomboid family serine protease
MQPHDIAADQPTFEQTVLLIAVLSGIVLGFINLFRLIATTITHRTIRKVIDSKPELAEALLEKLNARKERSGDDRLALILVAIGVAIALGAVIAVDDPGVVRLAIAAALFPLLVGGTLWLRFLVVERARHSDRAE